MNEKTQLSWSEWWNARPWRRGRWIPGGMSSEEKVIWEEKQVREYYATHRSARIARWGLLLGLLVIVGGFVVSGAYSRLVSDLGYGLMALGVVIFIISANFTSFLRS
jgi:hypothetical protein